MKLPAKGEPVSLARIEEICCHYGRQALWRKIADDPPERTFRCDGCSFWCDRWRGKSLYEACFLHDLDYWSGLPGEHEARLRSDRELRRQVMRITGARVMPAMMYLGVRLGGSGRWRRSFSWGFGRERQG